MKAEPALLGKRVFIARAASQAQPLQNSISQLGAHCECLGLFNIRPLAFSLKRPLSEYDGLIFTSRNSIIYGPDLPSSVPQCLAVGPGTAAELARRGLENVVFPQDSRSEGLLALPELHELAEQRWLIIKGQGGRDYLAQELSARGAQVERLCVYERQPIAHDPALIRQYLADIDYVLFFSGEGLQRLVELCPTDLREHLLSAQLVVPSARVVKMALDIGFRRRPCPADRMTDDAMLAALRRAAECE